MSSRVAVITFLDGAPIDPGYGVSAPVYPSQGLPGMPPHVSTGPVWGGHPSQGLPGGGHISLLPVFPFDPTVDPGVRPDNSLPGAPSVDNELPRPGKKYVVKWLCGSGLILVPDNELPGTAEPK